MVGNCICACMRGRSGGVSMCGSAIQRMCFWRGHAVQFSTLNFSMLKAPAEACARNEKFEKQLELAGVFLCVWVVFIDLTGGVSCGRHVCMDVILGVSCGYHVCVDVIFEAVCIDLVCCVFVFPKRMYTTTPTMHVVLYHVHCILTYRIEQHNSWLLYWHDHVNVSDACAYEYNMQDPPCLRWCRSSRPRSPRTANASICRLVTRAVCPLGQPAQFISTKPAHFTSTTTHNGQWRHLCNVTPQPPVWCDSWMCDVMTTSLVHPCGRMQSCVTSLFSVTSSLCCTAHHPLWPRSSMWHSVSWLSFDFIWKKHQILFQKNINRQQINFLTMIFQVCVGFLYLCYGRHLSSLDSASNIFFVDAPHPSTIIGFDYNNWFWQNIPRILDRRLRRLFALDMYMFVRVHIYIYIFISIYTYICIHIYIYTYPSWKVYTQIFII